MSFFHGFDSHCLIVNKIVKISFIDPCQDLHSFYILFPSFVSFSILVLKLRFSLESHSLFIFSMISSKYFEFYYSFTVLNVCLFAIQTQEKKLMLSIICYILENLQ